MSVELQPGCLFFHLYFSISTFFAYQVVQEPFKPDIKFLVVIRSYNFINLVVFSKIK